MLEGKFYDIQLFTNKLNDRLVYEAEAEISINGSHAIFIGHFPGNPIVPGVCEIQIIRELCSKSLGVPVTLVRSDNIKFLRVIKPDQHANWHVRLTIAPVNEAIHDVTASISRDGDVFFKFRGHFNPIVQ